MDGDRAAKRNRIMRVVALLFALAALAERAALRPLALRIFVHWLLRRAECAALTLVEAPEEVEARAAREAPSGADPSDLIRLAVSLRAIAIALAGGCAAPHAARENAFLRHAIVCPPVFRPGSGPIRLNDTS